MRSAIAAVVLLGLLAGAAAKDVSRPQPITGRLTCVLPVSRLQCIRDWRSGFVAGLKTGWEGITPSDSISNYMANICSNGIFNQTRYDMSVATGSSSVASANSNAPAWYRVADPNELLYPAGAPITQVIVLHAPNPWGHKYGNIPAIIFGYQTDSGLDFAICGNPVYANFYLNPARAPAPPTPVTLKAVYNSPLSEDDIPTALGSFEGKCGWRGTSFASYIGGDPWKLSHYRVKALKRVCFTQWNNTIQPYVPGPSNPPNIIRSQFQCDANDEECLEPCHYDKKHSKKSVSFSCAVAGTGIATGKYGAIMFDKHGHKFEYDRDESGKLYKREYEKELKDLPDGDQVVEGYDEDAEEEEEEKP